MRDPRTDSPSDNFDLELQKIRTIMLDLHVRLDKLEKHRTRQCLSSSSSDSSIASIEAD
jgi:hypothetical protein